LWESLNKIKEYEIPITKIGSNKTTGPTPVKSNLNPDFYNATRPALNLGEKKKKGWMLWIIVGFFIMAGAFISEERNRNTLDELNEYLNYSDLTPPPTQELCSEITRVPAWIQDGQIINHGYKPDWNVTYLIENRIYFLYSTTCSYCHKQIAAFGDQWAWYILSGYTQECW